MTFYQTISLINAIGIGFVIVKMTLLIKDYNIPYHWGAFFYIYYVSLWCAHVNQMFTLFLPANFGWLLKAASTLIWIAALYFCKALKKESVLK